VTYGAETWTVTSKIEKMFMTWERKVLRKIYGPTKENGQWRIKTNAELITKYKSQDIIFNENHPVVLYQYSVYYELCSRRNS
jgi:hypothetical protein